MVRTRRLALALAVGWSVLTVWAPPASAAPTLTVTPKTGLASGQMVTLQGSGYESHERVLFCQTVLDGGVGAGDCPLDYVATEATASGTFSGLKLPVQRYLVYFTRRADCAVDRCAIQWAGADGFAPTVDISFDPNAPAPEPDGRVKNPLTGQLVGDDVYSGGGSQSQRRKVRQGAKTAFALSVENEGPTDSILVKISPPPSFISLRVMAGYYDVTAAATGAGVLFRNMAHGQVRQLSVRVTVAATAPVGEHYFANTRFASATDGTFDVVSPSVVVRLP